MSRFDPDKWGMSVCTVDGQRFTLGDVNEPFTIQSCSKPFTYGINVDKLGQEVVDKYIGQEPSGRDFNEICLDSKSKFLSFLYKIILDRISTKSSLTGHSQNTKVCQGKAGHKITHRQIPRACWSFGWHLKTFMQY